MKNSRFVFMLVLSLLASVVTQAQEKTKPKKEKTKIVIIKETVDEDGNEKIEKTIKTEDKDKRVIWIEKSDNDDDIEIIIESEGEEEIDFDFEEGEEDIDIEADERIEKQVIIKKGNRKISIDVEEKDGDRTIKIVTKDGGKSNVRVISLEKGEELPEEVIEILEDYNIDWENMDHDLKEDPKNKKGKKKIKIIKKKEEKAY